MKWLKFEKRIEKKIKEIDNPKELLGIKSILYDLSSSARLHDYLGKHTTEYKIVQRTLQKVDDKYQKAKKRRQKERKKRYKAERAEIEKKWDEKLEKLKKEYKASKGGRT